MCSKAQDERSFSGEEEFRRPTLEIRNGVELKSKIFALCGSGNEDPRSDARLLRAAAEWLEKEENQRYTVEDIVYEWIGDNPDVEGDAGASEARLIVLYYDYFS